MFKKLPANAWAEVIGLILEIQRLIDVDGVAS
jgi:hypothetical protein